MLLGHCLDGVESAPRLIQKDTAEQGSADARLHSAWVLSTQSVYCCAEVSFPYYPKGGKYVH